MSVPEGPFGTIGRTKSGVPIEKHFLHSLSIFHSAEFAERSVDKLEATIDGLLEALMNEKVNYRNLSEKLDKTLNDMMSMT